MNRVVRDHLKSKTVVAAILIGGCSIIATIINSIYSNSAIKKDNTRLKSEVGRLEKETEKLNMDLIPFKTASQVLYGRMDTDALIMLASKLQRVHDDLAGVQKTVTSISSKTSIIRELPDGRTVIGDFVSGEPHVLYDLQEAAVRSYNEGDYSNAMLSVHELIKKYESSKSESDKKMGYTNTGWKQMASSMYSMLAEYSMSIDEYDAGIDEIEKANQLYQLPLNDIIRTILWILKGEFVNAAQIIKQYETASQEERNEYFSGLFQRGYLVPPRYTPETCDDFKNAFKLSIEPISPSAYRILLPDANKTNTVTYLNRWQGMGKIRPIPFDSQIRND